MAIRIGISGWLYAPWRGDFYPAGLRQADELHHASRQFPTIEINGTFYSLKKPADFARWRDAVPRRFVFAVKGSRYITHTLRLRGAEAALGRFFGQGVLDLGPALGPILWQLPPSFRFDADRLDGFLGLLPHTAHAAAKLAGAGAAGPDRRLRHTFEVRHDSFRDPAWIALLRRHRVGSVVADSVDWPCLWDVTSGFVYVRLHGSEELYASGYDPRALDRWARRVRAWGEGGEPRVRRIGPPAPRRRRRDVFVYFDNDRKVRAPKDAHALAERLGLA